MARHAIGWVEWDAEVSKTLLDQHYGHCVGLVDMSEAFVSILFKIDAKILECPRKRGQMQARFSLSNPVVQRRALFTRLPKGTSHTCLLTICFNARQNAVADNIRPPHPVIQPVGGTAVSWISSWTERKAGFEKLGEHLRTTPRRFWGESGNSRGTIESYAAVVGSR